MSTTSTSPLEKYGLFALNESIYVVQAYLVNLYPVLHVNIVESEGKGWSILNAFG